MMVMAERLWDMEERGLVPANMGVYHYEITFYKELCLLLNIPTDHGSCEIATYNLPRLMGKTMGILYLPCLLGYSPN